MLRVLNIIVVMLFVLVASAAPYVSAKGAALAFAQNPEERASQGSNLEEEIHHITSFAVFIESVEIVVIYPHVIKLKPQQVLYDVLKPPSRLIS